MAFKPEEIKRFETLIEEMTKLIEDRDTTSSEAAVVYGKIGRLCTRAIAEEAAGSAKRTARTDRASKLHAAREARRNKKGTPTGNTGSTQTRSQP